MTKKQNEDKSLVWRDTTADLDKPASASELASELANIIAVKGLSTNIQGKSYVNVEGWQLAGALTGIFPMIEKVELVPAQPGEIKYRAEVSLFRLKDEKKIGFGVAFCSNRERSKKFFDEYAIASMAQTRAVGKAFRATLGWLVKLAGYEGTPADEMPQDAPTAQKNQQITAQQAAWLKQVYRTYEGLSDEDIADRISKITNEEEFRKEATRLSAEYHLG